MLEQQLECILRVLSFVHSDRSIDSVITEARSVQERFQFSFWNKKEWHQLTDTD